MESEYGFKVILGHNEVVRKRWLFAVGWRDYNVVVLRQ